MIGRFRHKGLERFYRKEQWAVSVSGNWRLVFEFEGENATDVDLVDYH